MSGATFARDKIPKLGSAVQIFRDQGLPALCRESFDFILTPISSAWYAVEFGISLKTGYDIHRSGERPILVDFLRTLEPGDVFWDIGANQGLYTRKAAKIIPPNSILAVEPGDGLTKLCRDGPEELNTVKKGIEVNSTCFSAKKQGDKIVKGDSKGQGVDFETVSGGELLSEYPTPTVMKIDVNGWDLRVLDSLKPALSSVRALWMECEPPDHENRHRHPNLHSLSKRRREQYFEENWSFDDIVQILIDHGFSLTYLMDNGGDLFIKATGANRQPSNQKQPKVGFTNRV